MKVKVFLDEIDTSHSLIDYLSNKVGEEFDTYEESRSNFQIATELSDELMLKWVRQLIAKGKEKSKRELIH